MRKRLVTLLLILLLASALGCSAIPNEKDMPVHKLYINEVVSSNKLCHLDPIYGVRDWIELFNGSETDISLKELYISDNLSGSGKIYPLPDFTIPAGEYLVLLCGGEGHDDLLPFNLSKNGEDISLVNSHREEISTITVPALIPDVSFARRDDGTYGFCAKPTPGERNTESITDERPETSVFIEEEEEQTPVVYLPLKITSVQTNSQKLFCDSCTCWMDSVEITNFNETEVDIGGYCLNDKQNHVKKGLLPSALLQPNESIRILCCGENCAQKEEHRCIDLGLSKNGDSLYLYDPNEVLIDQVEIPPLEKEDAYSWQSSAWEIVKGIPEKTADAEPAAPGLLSADSSLRINELLYKNKYSVTDSYGDRSDFIELYNAASSSVSLNGWYLSDSEKRLDKWAFPDIILEPGAYLVVFCSGKESTDHELHASFSVSEGETVFLYDGVNNLADSLMAHKVPSNVSIGRENGEYVMYGAPTPGYANGHPWPLEIKE